MDSASPLWGVCRFDDIKDRIIDCRAKSRLPENTKSIFVACFPYLLEKENYKDSNVSKYAVVTDYHDVAINRLQKACDKLKQLYPQNTFAPFADNSPIPEVRAATLAGLGVRGKNSLLITKDYGSYVFLGEIVTDLEISAVDAQSATCIGCGKCITACPAKAIGQNGVDGAKCLSAITQKKGELTMQEKEKILAHGLAWGCDRCQTACPHTKKAIQNGTIYSPVDFFREKCIPALTAEALEAMTDEKFNTRAYSWRGRDTILRNLKLFKDGSN